MNKLDKIYVAGHRGLVGSAIVQQLKALGLENLLLKTHKELDLTRQAEVEEFFDAEKPDYVFLAAAKVGGILANSKLKADFIYQNLEIQNNIIHNSYKVGVKKLLFLGSSCIYPKLCPQPMREDSLLTGELEPTNDAYAVAKIAGIKMCQSYNDQYGTNYLSAMPTNLFGPGDNFDLESSHVLPAMLRKFHEAKEKGNETVKLWGSGTPKREFLYSQEMAQACIFLMQKVNAGDAPGDLFNIGTGMDISIKELALMIQEVTGHQGQIDWDATKPDGTPRKLMNVDRMAALGWKSELKFKEAVVLTYQHFKSQLQGEI